jgi:hypothetical protein
VPSIKTIAAGLSLLALAACAGGGSQFDSTGGVRITRSACPAVAVPTYTDAVTLFSPAESRVASAIDVVAMMTDVRSTCAEVGDQLVSNATFQVLARRTNTAGARDVTLPYFATVVRGGSSVVAKRVGSITLHFADGQARTSAAGTGSASVSRAEATLPKDVETRITRKRRPTDADASIDPMTDPAIRAAVSKASFELLLGFQLSTDQLAYNATK